MTQDKLPIPSKDVPDYSNPERFETVGTSPGAVDAKDYEVLLQAYLVSRERIADLQAQLDTKHVLRDEPSAPTLQQVISVLEWASAGDWEHAMDCVKEALSLLAQLSPVPPSPAAEYVPRDWTQPHLQALNYINTCMCDGVDVSVEKLRSILDVNIENVHAENIANHLRENAVVLTKATEESDSSDMKIRDLISLIKSAPSEGLIKEAEETMKEDTSGNPPCGVCGKPLFWFADPEYPQWKHVDRDPKNSPSCWGNPEPGETENSVETLAKLLTEAGAVPVINGVRIEPMAALLASVYESSLTNRDDMSCVTVKLTHELWREIQTRWYARKRKSLAPVEATGSETPTAHEFRLCGAGELDEFFISNASVHIERMDEMAFWIGIDTPNLPSIHIRTGFEDGKWFFNVEEDTLEDAKSFYIERLSPPSETKLGE